MTDPHVQNYASRVAEGLRADRYPNRLTGLDARMAAARYRVEVPHQPMTINEVALLIAQAVLGKEKR